MTQENPDDRLPELEADNKRLRSLLDERDAPGELRHRQRNTLAILRMVIRRSAETRDDVASYVAHLEDRLDALARAQAAADRRGDMDLHNLLADELLYYAVLEGERFALSGPVVRLRPREAQVLALAIHELAVNAVEHGALTVPQGRLDVVWRAAPAGTGPGLDFTWKESGLTEKPAPGRRGFGTLVLLEMIRFELKAESAFAFEPDGLRFTLRVP